MIQGTGSRVAAYVGALALVLVASFGVGRAVGDPAPAPVEHADTGHADTGHAETGHSELDDAGTGQASQTVPAGVTASDRGYSLELTAPMAPAGTGVRVALRVLGPDGAPLTAYEVAHEKELHLVAVRRDLSGFQHVHPERGADGTWRVPLDLTPGTWRILADFVPAAGPAAGEDLVLGADLAVAGAYEPVPLPAPVATTEVDGYDVALHGHLEPGREAALRFTVTRDGRPVTDLQPYLGARGHLVVLRAGDLAYLHAHPTSTGAGPDVAFGVTAPADGEHRAFLDFRHGGVVRTAALTLSPQHSEEHP